MTYQTALKELVLFFHLPQFWESAPDSNDPRTAPDKNNRNFADTLKVFSFLEFSVVGLRFYLFLLDTLHLHKRRYPPQIERL